MSNNNKEFLIACLILAPILIIVIAYFVGVR